MYIYAVEKKLQTKHYVITVR